MFLIVVFLWRDQTRMKREIGRLASRNASLSTELAGSQAKLAEKVKELEFYTTGDFARKSPAAEAKPKPSAPVVAEEQETFKLLPPTVVPTETGLMVRFRFQPVGDTPLPKELTLVVRVPGDSAATIQHLRPAAEEGYGQLTHMVGPGGRLGLVEGIPSDVSALGFELVVTGPVKATLRGSEGIRDFELDISPDGCSVRQL